MKAEDIVKRHEILKAGRSNVQSIWDYMTRFVMPYRASLYHSKQDGESSVNWRKRDIYDSTAPEAADALAASLQGNLISPSVKWFDLQFQDDELNEEDEAKEWLEECSSILFMALQQSNFNLQAAEALLDVVGFGTMALIEEYDEGEGELDFTAVPISEVCFEVGSKGQVKRFYRQLNWSALQIVDKFGKDNLPKAVEDVLEGTAGVDKKFDVTFCIYEREDQKDQDTSKPVAKQARPFGYKYILCQTKDELGDEGGYYEMPAFVTRWRTTAGSIWGNGPGFKVLSTIMDINEFVEITLEKAAQDVEPPLMTTQRGIISALERVRGGITVVGDVSDINELPGRGNADLAVLEVESMRGQVKRAFYEDQLELKESPAMTATEVNTRYELMQRLLGPTMGRLKTDFLDPLITRTFRILYRTGKLPKSPAVVKDNMGEVDVEYIGPLPRAQKAEIAHNTASWMGIVGNMVEVYPEAMDVIDIDAALRGIGLQTGVPAKFMHSHKEIEKKRKARQKQVDSQRQIDQAQQIGDAGQSLGAASEALPPEAIAALQGGISG